MSEEARSPEDFDGCRRVCRKAGKHTLVWGECEHAPKPPEPEPTVYFARTRIADDGYPVFWYEPVAIKDLDEVKRAFEAGHTKGYAEGVHEGGCDFCRF